jgi:ABA responsive element binding factor
MDLKDGDRRAPLARQGSIYSLTFDEFQSTLGGMGGSLGKDFGSMNMDELLRSIWTAEESQAMASASGPAPAGEDAALQRQGSLTLPRTLSVKTVDEVWRDFVREGAPPDGGGGGPQPGRQPTLGEMTLEEFLVRAGVVGENPAAAAAVAAAGVTAPIQAVNNGSSIFFGNFGGPSDAAGAGPMGFAPVGIGDPSAMGNGLIPGVPGMGGAAFTVNRVDTSVPQLDSEGKGNSDLSSPVPYPFEGVTRGRRSNGGVEKVVERRQRRMIKNRESAARSRARKQVIPSSLNSCISSNNYFRLQVAVLKYAKSVQSGFSV